ncbi:highly derived D5-like helicase-primase [Tunisvirus fontaine2]|uniref:Highly derived D5-like helicase-primase n=1 Tax=Tunisvirus fontaine2 TaxID=1421067 RepID=V9SEB1_9VIRU|nr:highly derived D5-like helicase-primase [Tunisvirus fontaine2]AHC55080.1 highly derived D5-like helicase-primase [Tunisvirus fontaine2]
MSDTPSKAVSHCSKTLTEATISGKLFVSKPYLYCFYPECFETRSLKPKRGCCIVAKDISDRGGKLCCAFTSRKEALRFVKTLGHLERNFYEVIPGFVLRCPYFDIDAPRNGNEAEGRGEKILASVVREIKYIFAECFQKKLSDNEFSTFTSSTSEKDSFHVYINTYCFSNKEDAKEFTRRVRFSLKERGEGYEEFLDDRVYSSWQCLRLAGCMKKGKGMESIKRKLSDDPKLFVCDVEGCEKLPSLTDSSLPKICMTQDVIPSDEREAKALRALYKLPGAEESLEYRGMTQIDNNFFLNFQMVCPWYCPICDREHDNGSNLNSAYILMGPRNTWLKCRSSNNREEERKILLVGRKKKARNGFLPCLIDPSDPWYWANFSMEFSGKVYKNREEMRDDVIPNMRRVFAYIPGSGNVVVKANKDECFKVHKTSFVKSAAMKFFLEIEGSNVPIPVSLTNFFHENHLSFTVHGLCFHPYSPEEDDSHIPVEYINTFEGFKAQPVDEGVNQEKIRPLLDHIFEVWADSSKENFDYVISWLSHIVKYPREKTGVALVILSEAQGAGKGIITDFLLDKVFGRKLGKCIGDIERVVHRFNSILDKKLLVILDEMNQVDAGAYHKSFDVIKHLITEKTVQIERKGVETTEEESFVNFLLTTNNTFSVKVEQSDRRYAMFRCSDKRAKDFDYFRGLARCLTDECARHFIKFLLDWKEVDIKNIPETSLKKECRNNSKNVSQLFLEGFSADEYDKDEDGWFSASEVYQDFVMWAQANGYRNIPNANVFGRTAGKTFEKKRQRKDGKLTSMWKYMDD